ncbi:hybrid sensor histidine kinase/response regulator [Azospirillum canadense]|uniref:hybrid sensor histidine kinase/response regulator n=1 Tax=Azospirillum canadense TaxID=403962 RepID=UPI0022265291|nr:PAS domain-containing protein [Azospirillum canadense]MCW2239359.1 PAS domain S-box-containing protein [Azospirillum canadense]
MPSRRLLFLLPLAVLPLLLFEVATQLALRDTRATEVRQDAMRLLDLVVSEQSRLVEDIRHVLGTVVSVGAAELAGPDCQTAFERMRPRLPDYLIVQYADRMGTVRCSTDSRALGAHIGDRLNVQRALATGAFAIGGYSTVRGIGHTVLTFGLPAIGPDGQADGVLTALLDVRWLEDYLTRKPLPPDAAVVLADRDGTILARTPEMPDLVGQPLPPRYRFMLEGTQRGISEVVGFDGIGRVVAYSPARADVADLMVWVGLSKAHAMLPVERTMWRTLAGFAGLFALAVLVTVWVVRHMARLREQSGRTAVKMARILESTNDAVLEVDRGWRVTFLNERAKAIFAGRGDLKGQRFWDVYSELVGTGAWSCCHQAMDANAPCEFEIAGPLSGRWFAARAFPSKDGLVVFFQDVTARKQAEQERERLAGELEKERTLFQTVLTHLPSGVFAVAAPDGRLLLHNPAAERAIGHPVYSAQTVDDYTAYGAVHSDGTPYRSDEYPLARALLYGETEAQGEMRYRRGDGTIATFAISAAPVRDANGQIIMAVAIFHDITERKRMEEALRQSEERLSLALASARAGTFDWDLRSGRVMWSEESHRIFGFNPDHDEGIFEQWLDLVQPEDRERLRAQMSADFAEHRTDFQSEYRIVQPDGRVRWVMGRGRITYGEDGAPVRAVGLDIDITERKQLEEALVHSQDRLKDALLAARAGSWELDLRTGEMFWSEENNALFGLPAGTIASGYNVWLNAVLPEDREQADQAVQNALATGEERFQVEFRIRHPEDGVRWLNGLGRAHFSADGRPVRLSGLNVDITERRRMEVALRATKDEAERASLAKSKFLAAASHDLRQPLQALFLFAAALHNHVTTERGQKALDTLERNLETLRGLLDSLLDVSRLDADVIRPTIEDFPLAPVLDDIGASFAPVASGRGLDFQVAVAQTVVVRSDRHLLGRMIRNLVENAIKYTEHGAVRLECRVADGLVRIAVHDTGIGIPPDQRELIFVEFHQVGNPGRDRTQGLGLGLAIVQRLSKLLGHPVAVRSTPGRGSVFTVDVPLGEAEAVRAPEPFAVVQPDGAGRLAVLIDDDADVLVGLQAMFRDWGYDTVTGNSAVQALERLRADGRPPAVIVSDYRLGENRTGLEAVRLIRNEAGRAVPGVILTGETAASLHATAAERDVGIVIKPVAPRQLYEVLKCLLGEAA